MDVDLDEFCSGGEKACAAEGEAVVDALSDYQEQIGFFERGMNGGVEGRVGVSEAERVGVGQRAFGHGDRVERKVGGLDELAQLGGGIAPPDAAACQDDGFLGGSK